MQDKNSLRIIKEFVEGDVSADEFEKIVKQDKELRSLISNYNPASTKKYGGILGMVDKINWQSSSQLFEIFLVFSFFIRKILKDVTPTDKYKKNATTYSDAIPSWLSDEASDYVEEEIIEKAPKGLTKTETKAWIKAKIKETFKYEKRPPQWAQEGNWPRDEEGNFLTFRSQKEDGDLVTYTFVNPKTGEEVQTQEFY